ncbi:hypothetical protein [Congregibacter litoralis]|uniref:Uncharacterized protein n=1 Tax=Congregibacter litoralis KT71 TaxID=314285 RepID=A4A4Z3_9GAMM|nr:hypothetical protein [Congregibacter litoralis]EAQ98864.2 hypothetical protein KT71_09562 [Congregibacter litoralis KT71]
MAASVVMLTLGFTGCTGDLPQSEFPCLVAQDRYNRFNETYVFSPMGDKERAMRFAQEAEAACLQDEN